MICAICSSTDFAEDNKGFFYCTACGTQNEEIFAESFENEGPTQSSFGKNIIKNYAKAERISNDYSHLQLSDILLAFQRILKLFVKSVADVSGVLGLVSLVKRLWFAYLQKWNLMGGKLMSFLLPPLADNPDQSSLLNSTRHEIDSRIVLLVPSRLLLLGFINLSCRIMRCWITPLDIIRWCRDGIIPFANAFESLEPDIKCKIRGNKRIYKIFVRDFLGQGCLSPITPSNILFHTFEIGRMINLEVPKLNAPLIARSIILSLALPNSVISSYAVTMQLLNARVKVKKFRMHLENVLASVILSCKMDSNWVEWATSNAVGKIPSNTLPPSEYFNFVLRGYTAMEYALTNDSRTFCSHLTRNDLSPLSLDVFLSRVLGTGRSTLESNPSGKVGFASFNKAIRRSMLIQPALAGVQDDVGDKFHIGNCSSSFSDEVSLSPIDLFSPHRDQITINLTETNGTEMQKQSKFRSGLLPVLASADALLSFSLFLPHIGLLERMSRYALLSPGLLQSILERDDDDMVGVAMDTLTRFTKSKVLDATLQSQKSSFYNTFSKTAGMLACGNHDVTKIIYWKKYLNMIKRIVVHKGPGSSTMFESRTTESSIPKLDSASLSPLTSPIMNNITEITNERKRSLEILPNSRKKIKNVDGGMPPSL